VVREELEGAGLAVVARKNVCGAKILFTARDHPDLQAEPRADSRHG